MTRSTTRSLLALLFGLFLTAGTARADQLQLLERAQAQRAARALPAGTLFVDWISHMGDSQPVLKRVLGTEVKAYGDGYFEVIAHTKVLGTATRGPNNFETPWDWQMTDRGAEAKEPLDLAYVYVPSKELDNTFICLGKKLKLPCEVDSIAIEVTGYLLHLLETQPATPTRGINGALGEPASGRRD